VLEPARQPGRPAIAKEVRELLAQVIVMSEEHLTRVLTPYVAYDYHFRTHRSLAMDGPYPRPVSPPARGRVMVVPEVSGRHHHDERQQQLLDQFGGLTFFPQPNEGVWTVAGLTSRDAMVIDRVMTSDAQEARRFLSAFKERLKEALQYEDILLVEGEVETLSIQAIV
jgi:hypothetical protein